MKLFKPLLFLHFHFTGENTKATVCTVGLWTDISVRVLKVPDLLQLGKELLGGGIHFAFYCILVWYGKYLFWI